MGGVLTPAYSPLCHSQAFDMEDFYNETQAWMKARKAVLSSGLNGQDADFPVLDGDVITLPVKFIRFVFLLTAPPPIQLQQTPLHLIPQILLQLSHSVHFGLVLWVRSGVTFAASGLPFPSEQ